MGGASCVSSLRLNVLIRKIVKRNAFMKYFKVKLDDSDVRYGHRLKLFKSRSYLKSLAFS